MTKGAAVFLQARESRKGRTCVHTYTIAWIEKPLKLVELAPSNFRFMYEKYEPQSGVKTFSVFN